MKHIKKFESPNYIKLENDKEINWSDSENNITFSYYLGKLVSCTDGDNHYDLYNAMFRGNTDYFEPVESNVYKYREDVPKETRDMINTYGNSNGRGEYSGRVFVDDKILTFWKYPENNEKLKEIVKDLEEQCNLDMWNDDWKIEIIIENQNFRNRDYYYTADQELIPIKEYKKSKDRSSEELGRKHMEVGKGGTKPGFGSMSPKNKREWRHALGESKLNENPDHVKMIDGKGKEYIIEMNSDDSFTFGYSKDKLKIGTKREGIENHFDLSYDGRHDMSYAGRIWLDSKLLSFWEYPEDYKKLREILTDIEKVLKKEYDIDTEIDDNWEIEIVVDERGIPNVPKTKYWGYVDSILDKPEKFLKSKVIQVGYYTGSEKRSADELAMLHTKIGKGGTKPGFGSMSPKSKREWRHALGESKLNESPDHVKILKDKNVDPDNVDNFYYLDFDDNDAIVFGINKHTGEFEIGGYENDVENHYDLPSGGRRYMQFPGRLWANSKVISFWEYPKNKVELDNFIEQLNNEEDLIDDTWQIEIVVNEDGKPSLPKTKFWGISEADPSTTSNKEFMKTKSKVIPINDYVGSLERSKEELEKAHLLSPLEKEKLRRQGKLKVTPGFGSTSPKNKREWRQALGESLITNFNIYENVDYQYYNKQLNPKFWSDNLFSERIREKLLTIANEFYNEMEYKANIQDIVLTGSLANYNWNKFSDLDVHVIIDFKEIDKNVELVKKAVDGQRFIWNLRHNVSIKGHDVELYIQDITEPHNASGIFSLKDNKWINTPQYAQPQIDEELVNFKFLTYKSGIDKLEEISFRDMSPESAAKNHLYASEFKNKIMKSRKAGLETPEAEFSVENLVFKKLRNAGSIEKLIDTIGRFYDKIYSQVQ